MASARATSPIKIGNGGTSLSHSVLISPHFPLAGVRCRINLPSETIPALVRVASSASLDEWVTGVSEKRGIVGASSEYRSSDWRKYRLAIEPIAGCYRRCANGFHSGALSKLKPFGI
jgi:hypothetical protein